METIEFTTKIKNGVIRIPENFINNEGETVKVIILLDEEQQQDKKEALLSVISQMQKEQLFADIDNPVAWQKKLRDEWE